MREMDWSNIFEVFIEKNVRIWMIQEHHDAWN